MKEYWEKLKSGKKYYLFLFLIIVAGILLRTYNFSDWVRFNDDQARDAALVRNVMSGTEPLPLMGPKAAGTMFKLGPMFYYFQYAAAQIFGNSPEKLAFPDLFFSILTIPLLFFFLRKYFSRNVSLIVTAVYSVSYFAVQYSRFAWNPNSMPFFGLLFLYSLLELAESNQKRKILWAVTVGMALGIGVQLHTLFIFIVPLVFLIFFVMVLRKTQAAWKMAAVIILTVILLNLPQIYSEWQLNGKNTHEFFSGLSAKSSGVSPLRYLMITGVCQIRANTMMVSSFGSSGGSPDECHLAGLRAQMVEQKDNFGQVGGLAVVLGFVLSVLFLAGGYLLLLFNMIKSNSSSEKNFLKLILIYAIVSFIIFIPLAIQVTPRFFLVLEFIPFVLLALWAKFMLEKFERHGTKYILLALAALVALNLYSTKQSFASYQGVNPERVSSPESVTLKEIRSLAEYIIANSGSAKIAYVDDHSGALFGLLKGISYFTDPNHIKVKKFLKKTEMDPAIPYFSVDLSKVPKEKQGGYRSQLENYEIVDSVTYGRFTIYKFGIR